MSKRKNTPPSQPSRNRIITSPSPIMSKTTDDIWKRLEKLDKLDTIEQKVNEIESKYEAFNNKQNALEDKINSNRDYINNLHYTLDVVQLKVSHLERAKICANLIVNGIPDQQPQEEDLSQLILKLCAILKIPIVKADIASCRRMFTKTGHSPIVVSLKDEETKLMIYNNWKEITKTGTHPTKNLLIKELYEKFQLPVNNYINITEEETRYTYNLFREAQQKFKGKFKYTWKKNGNIFTKLDDNSRGIKITSSHQIDTIILDFDNKPPMDSTKSAHENSFMSTRSSY